MLTAATMSAISAVNIQLKLCWACLTDILYSQDFMKNPDPDFF